MAGQCKGFGSDNIRDSCIKIFLSFYGICSGFVTLTSIMHHTMMPKDPSAAGPGLLLFSNDERCLFFKPDVVLAPKIPCSV